VSTEELPVGYLDNYGQLGIGSDPEAAALTVLGMGKLGAGELNYSSDIDLILLYDRDAPGLAGNEQLPRHFVRVSRMLVQLMSEASVDGYIFRTDLRLRPDPGSTPLAMSVQAACGTSRTVHVLSPRGSRWTFPCAIRVWLGPMNTPSSVSLTALMYSTVPGSGMGVNSRLAASK